METDPRLRERMNWDAAESMTIDDFLEEWGRASQNRAFVPTSGDSSDEAARRFIAALEDLEQGSRDGTTVAVVTHGGVTVDMLRTVLGDEPLTRANPDLIPTGVPCGAITSLALNAGQVSVVALPDSEHVSNISQHRPA